MIWEESISSRRRLAVALALLLPFSCSMTACGILKTETKGAAGSARVSNLPAERPSPQAEVPSFWYSGAEGLARARREQADQTPLAIYFHTDWCSYCKRFDEEFLTDAGVQSALAQAVKVRVNPEDGPEEKAVAEQFGVHGYPAFFIVQPGAMPRQVYPFKPEGQSWVATTPAEFATECLAAESGR